MDAVLFYLGAGRKVLVAVLWVLVVWGAVAAGVAVAVGRVIARADGDTPVVDEEGWER